MVANGVNLDALIPREDFSTSGKPPVGTLDPAIGIHHLQNNTFFVGSLRKPDFQRETTNWTPTKIVDLIRSFLDGDLIPAIILWKSGDFTFVIDGAHRLSAMLSWIYDDYGDRNRSLKHFDNQVPEEQIELARQTRKLIESEVLPFAVYQDALRDVYSAPEHLRARLGTLASNSFVAQWVPTVDAQVAQNSFFKINDASTQIDKTEKRIIKARRSALAIATRAINRGGTGHEYWSRFTSRENRELCVSLGREIHDALYLPPLGGGPLKSSDVPVAGRGYSSLPFLFDLVTLITGEKVKDSTAKDGATDQLADDPDGAKTVAFLTKVKCTVARITTVDPASLGLHPLVYFYTRGGQFQPIAFLAIIPFVDRLVSAGKLDNFIDIRSQFERFLLDHKEAITLIVKAQGSGVRSRPAIEQFFELVMEAFTAGKTEEQVLELLAQDKRYHAIAAPQPVRPKSDGSKGAFSSAVKSAAFVANLTQNGVKCGICGCLVHRNSMQTDHIVERQDGGGAHAGNAQIAHPYCNTGYKTRKRHETRGSASEEYSVQPSILLIRQRKQKLSPLPPPPVDSAASTPRDGKRDERLWGDCREREGSRPKPLGQAHGVEKGRPSDPLPTRWTMPETPVPGDVDRLT